MRSRVIFYIFILVFLMSAATQAVRELRARKSHLKPVAEPLSRVYLDLRSQVLHGASDNPSIPASPEDAGPFAVLMDWHLANGIATVVAVSDGSASIYLSSGSASIGGGAHESIRNAAQRAMSVAAELKPQMMATTNYPLPGPGGVVFYVVMEANVFTAAVPAEALSAHRHPLSKLGDAMQDIITQYRLVQTAK